MEELVRQLGIDWKLLLSQVINFLILLAILRFAAYKPILKILKERRKKIEDGLLKAEMADKRFQEITAIGKEEVKKAQNQALGILRDAEKQGKKTEIEIIDKAKAKEKVLLANAQILVENKKQEALKSMEKEAAQLVKEALIKTVELEPEKIDEALIEKAVKQIVKLKA